MKTHKVKQGDCISSISYQHGMPADVIWNDPENKSLKAERTNPNILLPGDEVKVCELKQRTESCGTEMKHRFRLKGVPVKLHVRLLRNLEPIGNVRYQFFVGSWQSEGTTDDDGWVVESVPPDADFATLLLSEENLMFELALGKLDPIAAMTGVQARLANLGYYLGEVDGDLATRTVAALKEFQGDHGLEVTGNANDATHDKLVELYGC